MTPASIPTEPSLMTALIVGMSTAHRVNQGISWRIYPIQSRVAAHITLEALG